MEDKIPQSFKVQWLNTTLKFVKDDNQMVIEYPQMPIAQVEYLQNLIWQRQKKVGLGFKSLYAPLWEAMKIFSVKYQFQVSVTKTATGDLGQLKIQKISKTTNEECNKASLEPNNQEIEKRTSPVYEKPIIMQQNSKSSNIECTKVVLSKNPNDPLSSENDTDSGSNKLLKALTLPEHSTDDHNASVFITSSDSWTIDYTDIETDDEFDYNVPEKDKSIVFNNATLKHVQNTAQTNDETKCDINNKNKIKNATAGKSTTDMDIDNDLGTKGIKLKAIDNDTNNTFFKPIEKIEKTENDLDSKRKKKVAEEVCMRGVLKNLEDMTISEVTNKEKKTAQLKDNIRSVYLKDGNTKKTPQVPKAAIVFAKASASTDNEKVVNKGTDTKVIPSSKKNKLLLEAMSTPLESDKALRMMQLMGWEGGALGLRGEGIIEPIIPDLHIKPGAGLGHVSEKSKKKQDKLTNRLQLLEAILDLVTSNDAEKIILCNSDITKKEKRFFNEIITLYNMNRTLNLSNKCENDLCIKIQESLAEVQHKLDLVHHSNRKLTLKKLSSTENKLKNNKPEPMILSDHDPKSSDITELPIQKTEYIDLILKKVLEFQKDKENQVLTVHFDSLLTTKYRTVLEKLCSSVNNRVVMTKKNVPHRNLAIELYENYDDSFYDITFGLDLKSFTIRKVKQPGKNASKKKNKAVKESKVQQTSEKDSKDTNNNNGSKEVELNAWSEVVNSKKNKSLILLVQLKTKKCPEKIAKLIARKINTEIEVLPHLKCHGVQDSYIVYSSYKRKSYLWLKNVLTDYRVIDYKGMDETYVLQIKINGCMDCKDVLNLLEKYNPGLNSKDWEVLDVTYFESSIEFLVQLGLNAFEHIRNNHFKLHAGVDEVQFTINIEYYSTYLQVMD